MCEILDDMCASCRKALHKCHPINCVPSPTGGGGPSVACRKEFLPECHWLRTGSLFGGGGGLSEERHPFGS